MTTPCDDLAGGQGGGEAANRDEEGTHEKDQGEGPQKGSCAEGWSYIGEETEKQELDKAGNPEKEVEAQRGEVFAEDELPGLDWSGEESFQGADPFFLRKESHGDERKDDQEIKPELWHMEHNVDQALGDRRVL